MYGKLYFTWEEEKDKLWFSFEQKVEAGRELILVLMVSEDTLPNFLLCKLLLKLTTASQNDKRRNLEHQIETEIQSEYLKQVAVPPKLNGYNGTK